MKKLFLILIVAALSASSLSAESPKEYYNKNCAKCHGDDGKGNTKMGKKLNAKDYSDSKVQSEMKNDKAFVVIQKGLKDKDGKILMKPSEEVTDVQIKELIEYMRAFKAK